VGAVKYSENLLAPIPINVSLVGMETNVAPLELEKDSALL